MQARARDSANVEMCASVTKAAVMMHDENMLELRTRIIFNILTLMYGVHSQECICKHY